MRVPFGQSSRSALESLREGWTDLLILFYFSLHRLSANMAIATLSTGMVGGNMGLSFWDAFAIILVTNIFSCLLPAWTASFGLTGLRMTTFS